MGRLAPAILKAMSDLTADQIIDLRRNWIRDEWRDSPGFQGISDYNVAKSKEFFSDGQITAIDDYVSNEYAEELSDLEWYKQRTRLALGDNSAAALTSGLNAQTYARFRLIRAEAWERMVSDPGFRRTLGEDKGLLERMEKQIPKDRNFVLRRTGVTTVPLRRG